MSSAERSSLRCLRWGLGRAGDAALPPRTAAHQCRGAVADAAVTCMAVLVVEILCFQFGFFLSLINRSRAGGKVVFLWVCKILTEPSKAHVVQPCVRVTSQSP